MQWNSMPEIWREGEKQTFFQSWLLSIPYKCFQLSFVSDADTKELDKGFRFKMTWKLPAQILTGSKKKKKWWWCLSVMVCVSEPNVHKSRLTWTYNASDLAAWGPSLPPGHKGLPSKLYWTSSAWKWILRRIVLTAPGMKVVKLNNGKWPESL